ncbi:hypothetical protein [Rhizobium mulingense]|uniref:hypothetical protein n=1 Tax=Rhizobium mulingense TaxID=3031128 RepID=UPI003A5216BB
MASSRISQRPAIIIGGAEHGRLTKLAEAHASKNPDVSDEPLQELERARVVEDALVPPNVVQMGSTVADKPMLRLVQEGGPVCSGKPPEEPDDPGPSGAQRAGASTGGNLLIW